MSVVECFTLDGPKKMIQKDNLVLRPAVYAIVVNDGKVLLMKMRYTDKFQPPGGGINVGERIEDAPKREIREETGIEVEIGRFARFEELFFYYDPSGTAYHGLHFYYVCSDGTGIDRYAWTRQPRRGATNGWRRCAVRIRGCLRSGDVVSCSS